MSAVIFKNRALSQEMIAKERVLSWIGSILIVSDCSPSFHRVRKSICCPLCQTLPPISEALYFLSHPVNCVSTFMAAQKY